MFIQTSIKYVIILEVESVPKKKQIQTEYLIYVCFVKTNCFSK